MFRCCYKVPIGGMIVKSIKSKILAAMIAIGFVSSFVIGSIGTFLNYNSAKEILDKSMTETADVAAARVQAEIKRCKTIAAEIGSVGDMTNSEEALAVCAEVAAERTDKYNLEYFGVLDMSGHDILNDIDCSGMEFFKVSSGGEEYCSDFMTESVFGVENGFVVSAPLWQGGIYGSTVAGVVYFIPSTTLLNDIVTDIQVGEGGTAYLLSSDGLTIAFNDPEVVGKENAQESAKTDPSYEKLAAVEAKMCAGETGFDQYLYNGSLEYVAYAPVGDTPGWSIGINVVRNEFMGGVYNSIFINLSIIAVMVIVAAAYATVTANRIARPIIQCSERIVKLSNGDLTSPVPVVNSRDETKTLADATSTVVADLDNICKYIERILVQIANGHLSGNFNA